MNIKVYAGVQTDEKTIQKDTVQVLAATNISVDPKYSETQSQALGVGGAFVSDGWVSRAEVSGDLETEASINQFKLLMESLGFTFAQDSEDNKKLNMEQKTPKHKPLTIVRDLKDEELYDLIGTAYVSSLKLSTTLQSYVKINSSIVAHTFETKGEKYAPTTVTELKEGKLICLGVTIKEESTDVTAKVESLDITIDRKLEGKAALNTIETTKVSPSNPGEVTINLQFNQFDKASYTGAQDLLKKNSSYKVEIEFKQSDKEDRKIKITFPRVKISNVALTDLEGSGGLAKDLKAYSETGKEIPFDITIENYTTD